MFNEIFRFELRRQLRSLSTYVYFCVFFALGVLFILATGGALPGAVSGLGGGGKILANSPYMLYSIINRTSDYGLLVIAAVIGYSGCQDFIHNSYPLIFTTPLAKWQYLFGRYLASCVTLTVIFSSIGLGAWAATFLPNLDQQLIGPNRIEFYLAPYLVGVIPNTLFAGALFLGMAVLGRRMMPVYVSSVAIFVGYAIAAILATELEYKTLTALIDPFGNFAFDNSTKYWSVSEKNTIAIPGSGLLLANRLIWLGVSFLFMAATWAFFQFRQGNQASRKLSAESSRSAVRTEPPRIVVSRPSLPTLICRLCLSELRPVVGSYGFLLIVTGAAVMCAFAVSFMGMMFGTAIYPVTAVMVEVVRGQVLLFMMIVTTVYSGEIVWRERDLRMNQLTDVLPIPTWVPYISKIIALILLQAVVLCILIACGIGLQVFKNFYRFEIGLYLRDLFGIWLLHFSLVAVLAIVVQSVVNQKYLGHFVMVAYYVSRTFGGALGIEHKLCYYAGLPVYRYSDMNGFGNNLPAIAWFDIYWTASAVVLAVVGHLFWVRGLDLDWRQRLRTARSRFSFPTLAICSASLLIVLGSGGYIYYNTTILNEFVTNSGRELRTAEYEQIYKDRMRIAQPRVIAARLDVDLDTKHPGFRARGEYQLKNKTDAPITTVFVHLMREANVRRLAIGTSTPTEIDLRHQVQVIELKPPMQPGDVLSMEFDVEYQPRGFKNSGPDNRLAENGMFIDSGYFPSIGYQRSGELSDEAKRRKRGLGPRERMPKIDDKDGLNETYVVNDADWTSFEATVSTSPDQIAVAPGALVREWNSEGRNYFQYKSVAPVLHFFSVLSARYQVKRDQWNDVAIEIYYHPGHEFNLDSMIQGVKSSLEYCSTNFGPYQHKVLRILEFPRYSQFAQAFSNTVPYSESIGFIARVNPKSDKDINYPVYVTAHEVAHQWWAHQVVGANVQGATLLSETLAQYSALMVMKHLLGPTQIRRFLKYELDTYLSGRSNERKAELPLSLSENQAYIHYNKGSLIMYAMQDYFGEETVNKAIASFLAETKFQGPPYPTSRDLIRHFREVVPADGAELIDDLFESITLFELKATKATAKLDQGKYEVRLSINARKLRADDLGVETEVPITFPIDIGVLGKKRNYLYLQKHTIESGESEITVVVDELPARAGIDPLNILVDRTPDDNSIEVKLGN